MTIQTAFAFTHALAEPLIEHDQPPHQAKEQGIASPVFAIDPLRSTQNHKKQTNGCHHGMAGWFRNKVVRCCAVCA